MKKSLTKKAAFASKAIVFLLTLLTVVIIHSCRKDTIQPKQIGSEVALINNNINLSMLKNAYSKGINKNSLKVSDVNQAVVNVIASLNVDWTSYVLSTYPDSTKVIEFSIPNDTALVVPGTLSTNDTIKYHTKTSAVFILRQDTINMSFFMKTVEDCTSPGYESVISNVFYNNEPSTFNGNVFYFTLSREYINGYLWQNGSVSKALSIGASSQQQQTQSMPPSRQPAHARKINKSLINEIQLTNCTTDVYGVYNVTVDEQGNILSWQNQVGTIYVTTCDITDTGGGSSSSGTSTISSGGGGVNGAAPLPKPCPGGSGAAVASVKGKLVIDVASGGSSGGSSSNPCAVVVSTPSTPIFGINNSNAEVPDANFDALLSYVQRVGMSISDPVNTTLTINGVQYTGQMTGIFNAAGQLVVTYFSPDNTSGPFQTGMEYAIGNSDSQNGTVVNEATTDISSQGIDFGNPATLFGNSKVTIYTSGIGGIPAPATTITTTILNQDFPCATVNILNVLNTIPAYASLTAPFATLRRPDLTWRDGPLPWAVVVNGQTSYQTGSTATDNRSATITLNTNMLQHSTQLMIAATAIHETLHAYLNYLITTNVNFTPPPAFNGTRPWMVSLDYWALEYGVPSGYRDHYAMMSDYFSKAVAILKAWDHSAHTDQQYEMVMLYGLNTNDFLALPAGSPTALSVEYNNLLTQYSITPAMLNTFWASQLISTTNNLPTGCRIP